MPEAAARCPGVLMVHVGPLCSEPVLKLLQSPGRGSALRLAPEHSFRYGVAENLGPLKEIDPWRVSYLRCSYRTGNVISLKFSCQTTNISLSTTPGIRIIKSCALNDAHCALAALHRRLETLRRSLTYCIAWQSPI